MKKTFFLLPIAIIALAGCNNNNTDETKKDTDTSTGGDATPLASAITLNYDSFYEEGKKGYAGYAGDYTINGYNLTLSSVMSNTYAAAQQATLSTDDFKIFQFKKAEGNITVTDVLPSKVTVKFYTTYKYSKPLTVSFGEGTVTEPTAASSTVDTGATLTKNEQSYSVISYEVEYTVSGTANADLSITNTNAFAVYVESIVIS